MLKMGIIGLPNVGKSTLFNAITNSSVEVANYPFATIKPNVGIVNVNDLRLYELEKIFNPVKTTPTTFEFIDIAGLIKGASKGEGLGNAFLANIKEVDALCHVIRCFEDKNITHVEGNIDPIRDIEIINLELIIADQKSILRQIKKIGKRVDLINDKKQKQVFILLNKMNDFLETNQLLNKMKLSNDELILAKNFQLLTLKKNIFVANIKENELNNQNNKYFKKLIKYAKEENIIVIKLCASFEVEISKFNYDDKKIFLEEYNINQSGLDLLVLNSYKLLGLSTFFTVGKDEVRALTFKTGSYAPDCAGLIHTDFKKGFIKAEVYSYKDFTKYKSEKLLKENGKIRLEGKNYKVQDGDICFFKFNI